MVGHNLLPPAVACVHLIFCIFIFLRAVRPDPPLLNRTPKDKPPGKAGWSSSFEELFRLPPETTVFLEENCELNETDM